MKKGKFKWIVINQYGNVWNGRMFIMEEHKAKVYLTHGKALAALTIAKAAETNKVAKLSIQLKKITIDNSLFLLKQWVQENIKGN